MSAIFSECRKYRYRLERNIDQQRQASIAWIMINPSTADAVEDDRTIKTVVAISRTNDFGKVIVGNLFAYVNSDVEELGRVDDPIGPDCDKYLDKIANSADAIVLAWGGSKKLPISLRPRMNEVRLRMEQTQKPILHIRLLQDGQPRHPLYVAYATALTPMPRLE